MTDRTVKKMSFENAPEMAIDVNKKYTAEIETSEGIMKFELLADKTPTAVNNFIFLAKNGFYKNTFFHRVVQNFMIQGGDPLGNGTGGPGYSFNDELPTDLDYERGILAMANAGPNTNGSQLN